MATAAAGQGATVQGTTRADCDISDPAAIQAAINHFSPDVVLNCAAWTDVDAAQQFPDAAFRINALGPRLLADACCRRGVRLVHVSTDYVFDGSAVAPLDEWQAPSPRSVYASSKMAGEQEVRSLCPDHQIVRTAWLYGGSGHHFADTVIRRARAGQAIRVVDDQTGSPTWTGHLAEALVRLVDRGIPGTYHLTNSGEVTWWGFAKELLRVLGVDAEVRAISSAELDRLAPRPRYSVLDNRAWRLLDEPPLPTWQEGVQRYIDTVTSAGSGTPPLQE